MSLVKIEGLKKAFKDVQALQGVSLSVNKNEIYGFIGKNGAGKTTTLNIFLSFLQKDEGKIVFDGEVVDFSNTAYKKKIGYVPDVPSFPPYLDPREILRLAADFLDIPNKQEKIDEVLQFVDLQGVTRKVGGFSRGMKQRLSIAQALLGEPVLLVMDEPTSALDPVGRREVLNLVRRLKATMTVFYSTHILDDAEKICDRIGLIDQGEILLETDMRSLRKNRQIAAFRLSTSLEDSALKEVLKEIDGVKDVSIDEQGLTFVLDEEHSQNHVLNTLLQKDILIHSMQEVTPSLEDVFVEVLHENSA